MDLKIKATVRISTAQYEFIELHLEDTPEAIFETYRLFHRLTLSGNGIPEKEFDLFVENQLSDKTNRLDTYEKMTPSQQQLIQINKRAIKRINSRLEKESQSNTYSTDSVVPAEE